MRVKPSSINHSSPHPSIWALLKNINCTIVLFGTFLMAMGIHLINPIIPEIISYFKISELKAGLVISLFTFPTIVLSPIVGGLADKYGYKKFLLIGISIIGIFGILPVFFNISFNYLLVIRTMQGIGFATAMPLTIAVLGDLHVGNQETAAQGMRNFFLSAGGFLFPILGGALALLGWNYPFICFSLMIPFAFIIYRYLPEPIKKNNKEPINLKYFVNGLAGIKDPYIILGIVSSLLRFFISDGVRFFLPIFVVMKFTLNLSLVGFMLGFLQIVKTFTALLTGNIVAYLGIKKAFIGGFLMYGLGCFLIPIVPSVIMLFFLMVILGISDAILSPIQKSFITQNTSKKNRGFYVSILTSMQGIGRTASPIALGIIMVNFGLYWSFWSMAIISLIPVFQFLIKIKGKNITQHKNKSS